MKKEVLEILLRRYYDGETTGEEEQRLRDYFCSDEVLNGFEAEKDIFRYYEGSENIPVPAAGFEDRIIDAVDNIDRKEKNISLRRRYIAIISSAAAIILLVFSYIFFFNKELQEDTFSDPELAYAETMKILYQVSVKLNKGTDALKELGKIESVMETGLESMDISATRISANLRQSRLFADESEKSFK